MLRVLAGAAAPVCPKDFVVVVVATAANRDIK
jgi:hypothetical protein